MQVALKIWRYSRTTGDKELQEFEIDAPEEATLLDCLDIVKDRHDGTLAYRKSCRMMICGSCGMRMNGAAVLACKVRMYEIAQAGADPGHLGDGEPAGRQGPRGRHGSVLGEVPQRQPVSAAGLRRAAGRQGERHHAGADERHPQGVAVHQLRLLRLGVQLAGVRPALHRAAGAREGDAVRRRPPRRAQARAARGAERRARPVGLHPLLLLQRALPEGRRPARRDREARCRVDEGGDRPRHGRQAREVVRHLGEDHRLAARDGAGAEDAGRRRGDQADEVRARSRAPRQGAAAVPAARREGRQGVAPPARPRRPAGCGGLRGHRPGREGARPARARPRRRDGVARGDLLPRRRVPAPVRPRGPEKESA